MVDLSDVIHRAVGGETGQLLDEMIDDLRRLMSSEQNVMWDDTEVLAAILYTVVENRQVFRHITHVPKVDNDYLKDAVNTLRSEIRERGQTGRRMVE